MVHPEKSGFEPAQIITYLGCILNSIDMTVKITVERAIKLREVACRIRDADLVTIRQVAELVGLMVASFPGVAYGPGDRLVRLGPSLVLEGHQRHVLTANTFLHSQVQK